MPRTPETMRVWPPVKIFVLEVICFLCFFYVQSAVLMALILPLPLLSWVRTPAGGRRAGRWLLGIEIAIAALAFANVLRLGIPSRNVAVSFLLYAVPLWAGVLYASCGSPAVLFRRMILILTLYQVGVFSGQLVYGFSTGASWGSDWAVGTIGRPGVNAHIAGVMAALTSLFWFFEFQRGRRHLSLVLSGLMAGCLFLTAATHVILVFAVVILLVIVRAFSRRIRLLALLGAVIAVAVTPYLPAAAWNIKHAYYTLVQLVAFGPQFLIDHAVVLKLRIFKTGFALLAAHPLHLFFGVGLANFNDRIATAAVFRDYAPGIASALKLSRPPLAYGVLSVFPRAGSVMNSVLSDVLSVVTETGIAGVALIFLGLAVLLKGPARPRIPVITLLLFVFLIGLFDNWLQYPQVGLMIGLLVAYFSVNSATESEVPARERAGGAFLLCLGAIQGLMISAPGNRAMAALGLAMGTVAGALLLRAQHPTPRGWYGAVALTTVFLGIRGMVASVGTPAQPRDIVIRSDRVYFDGSESSKAEAWRIARHPLAISRAGTSEAPVASRDTATMALRPVTYVETVNLKGGMISTFLIHGHDAVPQEGMASLISDQSSAGRSTIEVRNAGGGHHDFGFDGTILAGPFLTEIGMVAQLENNLLIVDTDSDSTTCKVPGRLLFAAWNGETLRVVFDSDGGIGIMDLDRSLKVIRRRVFPSRTLLTASPNRGIVLLRGPEGNIDLVEDKSLSVFPLAVPAPVSAAFSPDDRRLVVVGAGRLIRYKIEAEGPQIERSLPLVGWKVLVSNGGRVALSILPGHSEFLLSPSGHSMTKLPPHVLTSSGAGFLADDSFLFLDRLGRPIQVAMDGTARVWRRNHFDGMARSSKDSVVMLFARTYVETADDVVLPPNVRIGSEKRAAIVGANRTVIFDPKSGAPLAAIDVGADMQPRFGEYGRTLFAGRGDVRIIPIDGRRDKPVVEGPVLNAAENKTGFIVELHDAIEWRTSEGKVLKRLAKPRGETFGRLAIGDNEELVAAWNPTSGHFLIWDLATGETVRAISGVASGLRDRWLARAERLILWVRPA